MLLLSLGASVCWGVADFLAGRQARRLPTLVVLAGSQLVALCAYLATAALVGLPGDARDVLPQALLAGVFGVASLGAFYHALAVGRMSLVAPIVATGAAVPVLVGVLGGDRLGALPAAGIVLAIAGVALASRSSEHDEQGDRRGGSPVHAAALAVAAAGMMGVALVFLDAGAEHGVMWTLLIARTVGAGSVLALLAIVRPRTSGSARTLLPVAAVGLLEATASGVFAFATTVGALSLTAVLASLYPVVTVLLARTLLHEHLSGGQLTGVLATLAGVALMALR